MKLNARSETCSARLVEGVLRSMLQNKGNSMSAASLLAAAICGVDLLSRCVTAAPPEDRSADVTNIPARHNGVVRVIGTELTEDEKVPAEDLIVLKIEGKERRFRRLKVGDQVE